jgi:hypothetical protein
VATPMPMVASKTGGGTWSDDRGSGEDSDLATFSDVMSFAENRVNWWRARNKFWWQCKSFPRERENMFHTLEPGASSEWFVVDAVSNFYKVTEDRRFRQFGTDVAV